MLIKRKLRSGKLLSLTVAGLLCGAAAPPAPFDLLIVGGELIDGTGAGAVRADIGVKGDRIVFVGNAAVANVQADRRIDASGKLVTPGFIDPHTHSGGDLAAKDPGRRAALNHVMQGVTTVLVGNDGGGAIDPAPARDTGVNVARFVGFGPVRRAVIGDADRDPSPDELAQMRGLVATAMCEGAIGFSTGLYYAPQSFAKTGEVVALAREAALRGGIYDTHLREEGSGGIGLAASVDEAIAVGRGAGLPVHIAHIKALGADVHGQAPSIIAKIDAARASGLRVTADQYPWAASGTRLTSALVPGWAMDGGRDALRARLDDPKLAVGMEENLRRRGGAGAVLISGGKHKGKRLDALAAEWNVDPVAAAIRVIREDGNAPIASFNMAEADIHMFAAQSWVMASSDASSGHPRRYGSFAERWQRFVRDAKVVTPAAFVQRATMLTASTFGLEGRGVIREGNYADIAVIDPARFTARATYEKPTELATGADFVLVNGALVVADGQPTGALPGRHLAKPRDPSWSCPE
ncbi:N-acyl-D-amino-acid deacylase family protein [Sphingosinicella sp. LY1275]|uniref:N-acyl-D-amino-acid deacylase family protein n=1 Tax=Sphingosinicella sp. LY1275 TaxID=3095379 RepID=UPI002ADEEE1E|nr:amidohydrolase family protein [Sphingosinicella sp. LY1275]MEA1013933.1 amidohydrolase family protein [Sphingosinicella sp. LY1275]